MVHKAVQATLDALQVPALMVSAGKGTILAVNPMARQEISRNLMTGADYSAVMKEMGWPRERLAFSAVVDKDEPLAVSEHLALGKRIYVVASDMDEIQGWPPIIFVTLHTQPKTADRSVELHKRDRTAVEVGVLLDRARSDLAMMNDMLQATWRGVSHATQTWCDRIMMIEPTLPQA